jgi:hypothetical protein
MDGIDGMDIYLVLGIITFLDNDMYIYRHGLFFLHPFPAMDSFLLLLWF